MKLTEYKRIPGMKTKMPSTSRPTNYNTDTPNKDLDWPGLLWRERVYVLAADRTQTTHLALAEWVHALQESEADPRMISYGGELKADVGADARQNLAQLADVRAEMDRRIQEQKDAETSPLIERKWAELYEAARVVIRADDETDAQDHEALCRRLQDAFFPNLREDEEAMLKAHIDDPREDPFKDE